MHPVTVHHLSRVLRQQGLKLTRSRQAILQVLTDSSDHLTVAEVHRRAQAIDPKVGLASVYRTMDLLDRLGLVKHVHVNHRHRHYAPVTEHHGHHLVCQGCGRVVEFSDCQAEAVARLLARRTKFQILSHSMEFFGRCPQCQRGPGRRTGRRQPPALPPC